MIPKENKDDENKFENKMTAKVLENSNLFYGCRNCNSPFLIHKQKYCHECGYGVIWSDIQ